MRRAANATGRGDTEPELDSSCFWRFRNSKLDVHRGTLSLCPGEGSSQGILACPGPWTCSPGLGLGVGGTGVQTVRARRRTYSMHLTAAQNPPKHPITVADFFWVAGRHPFQTIPPSNGSSARSPGIHRSCVGQNP